MMTEERKPTENPRQAWLTDQLHQVAFAKGVAAARRQVDLSGKAATLDSGLLEAIVLEVIGVVVQEAMTPWAG